MPSPTSAVRLILVAVVGAVLGGGVVWAVARRAGPAATADAAGHAPHGPRWQCPMHPTVVQDHPGDCPICGMKLVPMAAEAQGATAPTGHTGPGAPGLAGVTIDPERQQLIGLRTAQVTRGPVGGAWRTNGRVAVDETRVHHLNVKFSGFVDHVHADFVGRLVHAGEPLFSIYSPELLAAQEELVLALRTRDALAGGATGTSGEDLVAAARRKLELWDVPADDLARLEQTRQATRTISIRSPANGVVVKKDVVPGMKVTAGDMPYEIVDLSSVWVLADVYEGELSQVRVGTRATLSFPALAGGRLDGRVAFIDPFLDPKTRTARVRIAVANPTGVLKPEMFGEVVLHGASHQGLRVPADAVIDSGTRSVVFVDQGEGKFQPRTVKLGDGDGEQVEIVEGLYEGETVVTRANFLVDSESRLKASLQGLGGK
jgi:Cu(I)/Ag(I) efflux system membrane fusion protein